MRWGAPKPAWPLVAGIIAGPVLDAVSVTGGGDTPVAIFGNAA
jgi:hypothetical protein